MQRKLKRKLSDISFEHETAHVALVSKNQQGPANGHDYAMVLKSRQFSPEFITKASSVKVELEITEYLERFFHLYGTQAEILARTLGFTTAGMDKAAMEAQEELLESTEPPEYPDWDKEPGDKEYEAYVNSKLASIQVMKSLKDSDDIASVLVKLTEDDYLQFLQDQSVLEKAFKAIETEASKATEVNKQTAKPKPKQKEQPMQKQDVELVEKSALAVVQKALEAQTQELEAAKQSLEKANEQHRVELQKALDAIADFKLKETQAVTKARLELVKAAVKDDAKADVLFKAVGLVEDEAEFTAVVKALAEMQAQVEKSALFQEQGTQLDEADVVKESAIARVLKARAVK